MENTPLVLDALLQPPVVTGNNLVNSLLPEVSLAQVRPIFGEEDLLLAVEAQEIEGEGNHGVAQRFKLIVILGGVPPIFPVRCHKPAVMTK